MSSMVHDSKIFPNTVAFVQSFNHLNQQSSCLPALRAWWHFTAIVSEVIVFSMHRCLTPLYHISILSPLPILGYYYLKVLLL